MKIKVKWHVLLECLALLIVPFRVTLLALHAKIPHLPVQVVSQGISFLITFVQVNLKCNFNLIRMPCLMLRMPIIIVMYIMLGRVQFIRREMPDLSTRK